MDSALSDCECSLPVSCGNTKIRQDCKMCDSFCSVVKAIHHTRYIVCTLVVQHGWKIPPFEDASPNANKFSNNIILGQANFTHRWRTYTYCKYIQHLHVHIWAVQTSGTPNGHWIPLFMINCLCTNDVHEGFTGLPNDPLG